MVIQNGSRINSCSCKTRAVVLHWWVISLSSAVQGWWTLSIVFSVLKIIMWVQLCFCFSICICTCVYKTFLFSPQKRIKRENWKSGVHVCVFVHVYLCEADDPASTQRGRYLVCCSITACFIPTEPKAHASSRLIVQKTPNHRSQPHALRLKASTSILTFMTWTYAEARIAPLLCNHLPRPQSQWPVIRLARCMRICFTKGPMQNPRFNLKYSKMANAQIGNS